MRPAIGIFVLIVLAIGVATFSSYIHPGAEPPLYEKEEQQLKEDEAARQKQAAAHPNTTPPAATSPAATTAVDKAAFDKVKEGAIRVFLDIENRGSITMELYPKAAPKTVAHFVALVNKGFYDGIKIHRVEPGFVVQMGDPESKDASPDQFQALNIGSHGSGTTVPLEAHLPHLANSIGLARSSDLDSGDSQFYINLADNAALDGKYCVFGRIVDGADIPPKLQIGDKIKHMQVLASQ